MPETIGASACARSTVNLYSGMIRLHIHGKLISGFDEGRWIDMATGWAPDGAVQDQIDATVKDGISRAREQLPQGRSLMHCAECGSEIPAARRTVIVGVRLCVSCQDARDRDVAQFSGYNRRGSKDSQLR